MSRFLRVGVISDRTGDIMEENSEPVIYTGGGTTDEVICMLDDLINRAGQGISTNLRRSWVGCRLGLGGDAGYAYL